MEQESKITWENPVESAEQMLSEHAAQNECLAGIRKQLAESEYIKREIGRMTDEELMELADMCLDELEEREYDVLRMCCKQEEKGSPFMLDVVGNISHIASMLTYLGVKKELFAKCLKAVVAGLEQKKDELEAIINEDMGDADAEEVADE